MSIDLKGPRAKVIEKRVDMALAGESYADIAEKTGSKANGKLYKAQSIYQSLKSRTGRALLEAKAMDAINWTREKSSEVAATEFLNLRKRNPGIAFRYKENLDKVNGLFVEQGGNTTQVQLVVTLPGKGDAVPLAVEVAPEKPKDEPGGAK